VRSADPFYQPGHDWIVRRLAPRSSRIELGLLGSAEDVLRVLWAMGCETANVHLGTPGARERVLDDLVRRPAAWLAEAAKAATQQVFEDWREWLAAADARAGTAH
jgi:sugar phosphate isomerase/epimerase